MILNAKILIQMSLKLIIYKSWLIKNKMMNLMIFYEKRKLLFFLHSSKKHIILFIYLAL